jgi:hypothetical protein
MRRALPTGAGGMEALKPNETDGENETKKNRTAMQSRRMKL